MTQQFRDLMTHGPGKYPSPSLSRRLFVGAGLAAGAVFATGQAALAGTSRKIRMHNAHTDEKFDFYVLENGQWVPEALSEFDWFSRDWRERETYPMATKTLIILSQIGHLLETDEPFVLLSGYRTPKTNSSLKGAAKHSLHMRGKALDITHPNRSTRDIHRAAVSLRAGGVGYYPNHHFVHIDSGNVRYWQG